MFDVLAYSRLSPGEIAAFGRLFEMLVFINFFFSATIFAKILRPRGLPATVSRIYIRVCVNLKLEIIAVVVYDQNNHCNYIPALLDL